MGIYGNGYTLVVTLAALAVAHIVFGGVWRVQAHGFQYLHGKFGVLGAHDFDGEAAGEFQQGFLVGFTHDGWSFKRPPFGVAARYNQGGILLENRWLEQHAAVWRK